MKWHSLTYPDNPSSEMVSVDAETGPDSPWFSGHFPADPILPGIAQLEMAFEAIKGLRRKGLRIAGVKKVRFKQVIRPDDKLNIIAAKKKGDPSAYTFRIMVNGELACSGIITVEELGD